MLCGILTKNKMLTNQKCKKNVIKPESLYAVVNYEIKEKNIVVF